MFHIVQLCCYIYVTALSLNNYCYRLEILFVNVIADILVLMYIFCDGWWVMLSTMKHVMWCIYEEIKTLLLFQNWSVGFVFVCLTVSLQNQLNIIFTVIKSFRFRPKQSFCHNRYLTQQSKLRDKIIRKLLYKYCYP